MCCKKCPRRWAQTLRLKSRHKQDPSAPPRKRPPLQRGRSLSEASELALGCEQLSSRRFFLHHYSSSTEGERRSRSLRRRFACKMMNIQIRWIIAPLEVSRAAAFAARLQMRCKCPHRQDRPSLAGPMAKSIYVIFSLLASVRVEWSFVRSVRGCVSLCCRCIGPTRRLTSSLGPTLY